MTLLSAVAAVDETPIDRYLQVQADLTAVERFSQHHDARATPLQARYYRDLIPLRSPEPGQQYAFAVDLDVCTGCKACVTACHSLNGLDDGESWRSVTLLTGGTTLEPLQQTVTSACHHCVDPACLNGCPVDAYEKDPVTGIVSHLDDQCIGCSYCTLTCAYEVPVFNKSRGIVRKCDMCQGRLAAGEAPACVQACPNEAISIEVVDVAVATATAATGSLVPGAPPSAITTPTTIYRTTRDQASGLGPALPVTRTLAAAHTPLAVMLVLTQLAVGAFVTDLVWRALLDRGAATSLQPFDALVAAAAGVLALAASVFHLGRPRYCYRAVIGLRHSWLSREVVAFGVFTGLAVPYAFTLWLRWPIDGAAADLLGALVAVSGVVGLAASVMIYATTHRESWRPATVAWKFALTAAVCGLATVVWAMALSSRPVGRPALLVLAAFMVLKLVAERHTTVRRLAAGVTGGVIVPLTLLAATSGDVRPTRLSAAILTVALTLIVMGELLERSLFFTTASAPR